MTDMMTMERISIDHLILAKEVEDFLYYESELLDGREFEQWVARNKSWREAERILEREFVGTFGQRDIREIKRFDVLEIMDAAVARGSTYQANRILSNIRKLFNWCVERGIVEISPINGLKAPTKEESRERVLEDDEIVRLLRACRNDVYLIRRRPHPRSCFF